MHGYKGTGKTTLGQSADDCYAISLTDDMPAAELRGHYIPEGNRFVWHDGPAILAWREGKRLVLNELDKASGDVLALLQVILDDPKVAKLTLPTGETIRPAEGFHSVATMNGAPADLPDALVDRFPSRINVDEANPDSIKGLTLRQTVIDTIHMDDERKVSTRQARAFDELTALVGQDLAARAVFGDRAKDILTSLKIAKAAKV
jgi:MoxR-like ATPase